MKTLKEACERFDNAQNGVIVKYNVKGQEHVLRRYLFHECFA